MALDFSALNAAVEQMISEVNTVIGILTDPTVDNGEQSVLNDITNRLTAASAALEAVLPAEAPAPDPAPEPAPAEEPVADASEEAAA